jgi:Protein of unknown function (DUF1153)
MFEYHNSRPARIIGPDSEVLTEQSLPPPNTTRWVASRKAQVVVAVQAGLLTFEQVQDRYGLSLEEFYGWQHAMDSAGVAGLRVAWSQEERTTRRQRKERPGARLVPVVTH